MTRQDEVIFNNIWKSLLIEKTISSIDLHDITVNVENGQVCLSGHVSNTFIHQKIEEVSNSTLGVLAVHNHLVIDNDLIKEVTQTFYENDITCFNNLHISCHHGWIEVSGFVPDHVTQLKVEATASSVANVRGITLIPTVECEKPSKARNAVQPGIGVSVFEKNGKNGIVYQVVINPQNRLVTHAVIRVKQSIDRCQDSSDYLVPAEAMSIVDVNGIFLVQQTPAIDQFPVFVSGKYPLAPLKWQPPYPYLVGNVRWPLVEKKKANQRKLRT